MRPYWPRCSRPGCRHGQSRHTDGACSCGCPEYQKHRPHWWRELTVETHHLAYLSWSAEKDRACQGYAWEEKDYREHNPAPKFRDVLIRMAGRDREES